MGVVLPVIGAWLAFLSAGTGLMTAFAIAYGKLLTAGFMGAWSTVTIAAKVLVGLPAAIALIQKKNWGRMASAAVLASEIVYGVASLFHHNALTPGAIGLLVMDFVMMGLLLLPAAAEACAVPPVRPARPVARRP